MGSVHAEPDTQKHTTFVQERLWKVVNEASHSCEVVSLIDIYDLTSKEVTFFCLALQGCV